MPSPNSRGRAIRSLAAAVTAAIVLVLAAGAFYDPEPGPLRLARRSVLVNGRRVAFHQTGTGPDVVLLHGGMGSAEDFEPIFPLLTSSRRLIVVDRPGFGGSEARADDCTFPGNARQIAGLIRALGLARPVVVGHSHGGGVALRLAADEPALVGGLVLIAPAAFPSHAGPGSLDRLTALPVAGPGLLAVLGPLLGPGMIRGTLGQALGPDAAKVGPEFVSWRAHLWTAPRSLSAHARQQVSDHAGLEDLQTKYAHVVTPSVAIWCDQDPYEGDTLDTHRLAMLLPHAKEVALHGCGHYVQYSRPGAVTEAILALGWVGTGGTVSEQLFPDLRAFLGLLRRERELVEIEAPVDARLEAAEIHRRVIAAGGPALLFKNVRDADFPLVTNLFGTARRTEWAFGQRPLRLIKRLVGLAETLLPPTPQKLWNLRDVAAEALKIGLKRGARGPVLDVVTTDVRLDRLPVLTCWPEDGGPFVTLPLVYTEDPRRAGSAGASNLGMYRLHVHSPRTTGMHWQIGKGGGFHYAQAEARNEPLPVTVFLGGPPALILSAIAPLPENVPELMLASLIAGERLPVVPGPGAHPLVASAEFALSGRVAPHARQAEGPFGDHYGYYSLTHDYPVFEVQRLAHRRDAFYPATVVGKPRQEDFFIGDLLQELLSPLFPLAMPAVRQLWSYGETGYHSLAAAVVQERYAREAMASAFRILGEGQLSLTKFLLVTDRSVDLHDFRATLTHVLERTHPETDLYVFANLSMDTLDYTGPAVNRGSKGVWLGLGDPVRTLPREFRAADVPQGVSDVHVFSPGCLVIGAPPFGEDAGAAERIVSHAAFADWPLLVLSDEPGRAARSTMNFLWTTFTRFEPAADIHAAGQRVVRNHIAYRAPILIDARLKPGFPKELSCDPETAATVTRRWREYFPRGGVEMGDSETAHLD